MWLDLPQLLRSEDANVGNSVYSCTLVQLLQSRPLSFVSGNNQFPADFMRNIVRLAESNHLRSALHAKACFQGSGPIVDSRVNYATVVASLMGRYLGFFFEDKNSQARIPSGKLPRGPKAYDAGSNHHYIVQCAQRDIPIQKNFRKPLNQHDTTSQGDSSFLQLSRSYRLDGLVCGAR